MTTYTRLTSPSQLSLADYFEAQLFTEMEHARQHKGMLCPDLDCRICERRAADQREELIRQTEMERI